MLSLTSKRIRNNIRPRVFPAFFSVFLSSPHQETVDNAVFTVSSLLKKPGWEQNSLLKSLVSHMSPQVASQVISLHCGDTDLCFRFFKWVSKQSTYCYEVEHRIQLLEFVSSSSLYGLAHKATVWLLKECGGSGDEITKLMGALDGLRKDGFRLNYPCYSTLLMSLAKLDLGVLAYMTFKKMVADGFSLDKIDYRNIINALCKNRFVQSGEMFLGRVLKLGFDLDTHICTSLVLGHCRNCNLDEAFKVFGRMSESEACPPNSVTFTVLIHGLCEIGRLEEAFGLKERMIEKCLQPSTRTYTILIKALCDNGSIDRALCLLDEMLLKGCKPNVHTYTVLIDGLCRDSIEDANAMFRKMVKDGLYPGLVTYNALINGYCKHGGIVSAFEILSMMEKRNCRPSIRTYNELMEGLCKVGKPFKAMLLFKKIIENGLVPNRVSYNVLIDGFCREGLLTMAYKIFTSMSSFGTDPDCLGFTGIIDGLCKQGNPELASAFLGMMLKRGIFPDEVALTALVDGHCKKGKIRDALILFETLIGTTCLTTVHSLNVFLDVLSKALNLKEEYALLGKILRYGLLPSVVTYTILVAGLVRSGDVNRAMKMMELMMLVSCPPNVYTYTILIGGLCQAGRIEEAEKLLEVMHDLGVPPNHITYTLFAKAYVNSGRLDRALDVVHQMVGNRCQFSNHIYSVLLQGFVQSQKPIEAGKIDTVRSSAFRETEEERLPGNIMNQVSLEHVCKLEDEIERRGGSATGLCDFLVRGLCKGGRTDEAYDLILRTLKRGTFPRKAIESIVEYYHSQKHYDKSLDLIKLILGRGFVPSFPSFSMLIHGLRSEGRTQEALGLVGDLLRSNGLGGKSEVLPYIEFLLKEDEPGVDYFEILRVVEQLHSRERPII